MGLHARPSTITMGIAEIICPVCDGRTFRRWEHHPSLDLHLCLGCSLLVLIVDGDNHFDEVEEEFFGEGYLRRQGPFAYRFLVNKARLRINEIRKIKPTGKFLDLGCGTGELVGAAKEAGYEAAGLDYSKAMVDYVSQKYDVDVYHGEPTDIDLKERFDVVAMSHIIEHVFDPKSLLRAVFLMLKPGGLLYIATPNIDCLESRFAGWGSYEPYHCLYFNPKTIELLIGKVGFKLNQIYTWEPYAAWLNTAMRSVMPSHHAAARRAVHNDTEGKLSLPFITSMAVLNISRFASGLLLSPLRKYQERSGRGEELVAMATRPS